MKKVVLTYGLISGAIMGLMIFIFSGSLSCTTDPTKGMIIGYTTMIVSLSLVFVGTKNYRDKFNSGAITFGRAFGVGILIAMIASVIYVIAWMLVQHFMIPDFYDKYANYQVEALKAAGTSGQELINAQKEADDMRTLFQNPVAVFFLTFLEPLPVAILVTLISALILKKKPVPAE